MESPIGLLLFKYCLPLLFGYMLFMNIAWRVNPLKCPPCPQDRPSWFLGCWVAITSSALLMVCMHVFYNQPVGSLSPLFWPIVMLTLSSVLPGLLVYVVYRRTVTEKPILSRS